MHLNERDAACLKHLCSYRENLHESAQIAFIILQYFIDLFYVGVKGDFPTMKYIFVVENKTMETEKLTKRDSFVLRFLNRWVLLTLIMNQNFLMIADPF